MIRLGLCCLFRAQPIKFRTTTATSLLKMKRPDALRKLSVLCRENALALRQALEFCATHHIGAFRVNSQILPVKTHPAAGYDIGELPGAQDIVKLFKACGDFARRNNIRLSFHPDQFILLNSPSPDVTRCALRDLAYQAEVSRWINADVINIHGGGGYGDKDSALKRLARALKALSAGIKSRLTLENDDKTFTPRDLLPVCREARVPLAYDVHHHRCLPDGLSVREATEAAIATWNREPLFHVSSPLNGWKGKDRFKHHDFINIRDFPEEWKGLNITVEVEAKAKELAVLKLRKDLKI